jgi:DNA-directed RNA polymerase subunit E"
MAKKQACKRCKALYESGSCPICKSEQSAVSWKGRLFILNPAKSDIAKKIGIPVEGEYAIKVN